MKKLILLAAVVSFQLVSAQNFTLTHIDSNELMEDGAEYEYTTLDVDTAALWFGVNNTSDEGIQVMAEFVEITNTDGEGGEFCLGGHCFAGLYVGDPYPVDPVQIAAGESDNSGKMWNFFQGTDASEDVTYVIRIGEVDDNLEFFGETITFTYIYRAPVLSNDSFALENEVTVYPTIANNVVNVSTKTALDYSLYAITGQAIATGKVNATEGKINTSSLNAGVYILNFKNEEGISFSKKFMKK